MRPISLISSRSLRLCLLASGLCLLPQLQLRAAEFNLSTATIADIQAAMNSGALTSEKLTQLYINRIEAYDAKGPKIASVLFLNPNALAEARALDAERKTKGPRGPLHGVVVIAKDVFDTADMPTTGGFVPLKGVKPSKDAFIIKKLREAGCVILAKLNQSDWYGQPANTAASTLGGNTLNPYDLKRIPGWSSAGTGAGMAAVFGTIGLGSETGFSIRTPTSDSNLYGLSTTSGLISRDGQMWSYITGERGGPMTRSVYDLAASLDVIAGFDAFDLWTAQSLGKMPLESYVSFIDKNGLKGARVGVLKEGWDFHSPAHDPDVVAMAKKAIAVFGQNGAKVIDPVALGIDLPQYLEGNSLPSRYERIHAINHYLARQGPEYPFKNARQLLLDHGVPNVPGRPADKENIEDLPDLNRDPEYRATLAGKAALRAAVIALMDKYELDALIYPHKLSKPLPLGPRGDPERKYTANQMSPLTGLPAMIVPMGFTPDGNPVGLEILGRPWSEPTLIKIASGYEASAKDLRKLPPSTPALPGESITY
ncbi:amidase [Nibricoccus aquaticus]|uniref:Amidase n=1 Tax=Nibricoccus aquaticus TaxID=2576891 RepID=A0A290Q7U2_9BACT|nr:amidase family protein [Nibricoccus aquaticus]ATC64785.1 amidase [Nibricoccus aquaticus]